MRRKKKTNGIIPDRWQLINLINKRKMICVYKNFKNNVTIKELARCFLMLVNYNLELIKCRLVIFTNAIERKFFLKLSRIYKYKYANVF